MDKNEGEAVSLQKKKIRKRTARGKKKHLESVIKWEDALIVSLWLYIFFPQHFLFLKTTLKKKKKKDENN